MRKAIMTAVLLAAAAGSAAAQDTRLVTMTGYGTVQGTPDQAWITVGVERRDPQPKPAQQAVAAAMTKVQQRLAGLGIPAGAIRTSSFNVAQDWAYTASRRTLRGYVVSNQVEIRVDDISKVPEVIDGSIAAGANIVHGIRWDIQDRATLEQRALREAFDDARARANVIATAAGQRLGAVHAVEESRAGQVRPRMVETQMAAVGNAASQSLTVINPGEMEIRAVVTVSFLLQRE